MKLAMRMSGRSRYAAFADLKRSGIYNYNINVLKKSEPQTNLLRERHQGQADLVLCRSCKGFFSKQFYKYHVRKCSQSASASATTKPVSVDNMCFKSSNANEEFNTDVISKFRKDAVGELCRGDATIKLVGERLYAKLKKKPEKKMEVRKSVMSDMRRLGNLYTHFADHNPAQISNPPSAGDMLHRKNFPALESAIQSYTGEEDVKAGLKSSLYYLIKNMADIVKASYMVQHKDSEADEVDKFVHVLELNHNIIFGDAAYKINKSRQTRLRRPENLPVDADIASVRNFTTRNIDQITKKAVISSKDYTLLRDLSVSRLTMFNFRRGGEPARLRIEDWTDAKKGVWVNQNHVQKMNPEEKELFSEMKIIYQTGKGNDHLVPVLVPLDMVMALDLLCDPDIRRATGVQQPNPYLFPGKQQSSEHCSGWHAVHNVCVLAGVHDTSTITATKLRHYSSTRYAALEIPEGHREHFYKHMGHSKKINESIYQAPLAEIEVTVVGKVLRSIDRGSCIFL